MSDFKQTWIKGFRDLAVKIAVRYQVKETREQVLSSLKFYSVYSCLMEAYNTLVEEKEIVRLEELPEKEKWRLWDLSSAYGQGKTERTIVCKCIYLLEIVTKQDDDNE